MSQSEKPLVSILCITYNHEDYIAEAIKGFLLQKTDFTVELIIHDDASTDRTPEIIKFYEDRHPELIRAIYQAENQYSKKDGSLQKIIFRAPTGEFTAICEGDDYWTDPNKLQLQVDFLRKNKEYGLVHHEADYYFQEEGKFINNHHKTDNIHVSDGYVYTELLGNNNIYTPTVVLRTALFEKFLKIEKSFQMDDYVMWLEFSQHFKFHYIEKSMAVYRILKNSASRTTQYEKSVAFVNSYCDVKLFFLNRYPNSSVSICDVERDRLSLQISTAIKYKKNKNARLLASQMKIEGWKDVLKRLIVFAPPLFRFIQQKNKH
jgi:glycosyltransferase involved in cell wall biosynthesis